MSSNYIGAIPTASWLIFRIKWMIIDEIQMKLSNEFRGNTRFFLKMIMLIYILIHGICVDSTNWSVCPLTQITY